MALTSRLHRCRSPRRNRGIPMILAERFDGGSVDVSAVDTGLPVGSTPRDLGAGAGRSHPWGRPHPPLPGPRPTTSSSDSASRRHRRNIGPSPHPPRGGLLHEGGDLLAGGCAYCTKAPPTWSTPDPPSVDPHPRASQASHRPSHCEQPNQPRPAQRARTIGAGPPAVPQCLGSPDSARSGGRSCSGPLRRCLRRHDIRKSQKS